MTLVHAYPAGKGRGVESEIIDHLRAHPLVIDAAAGSFGERV